MKLACTCKHQTQDEWYGVGIRVHNQMKDPTKYKCTVCSNIKTASAAKAETKDKK